MQEGNEVQDDFEPDPRPADKSKSSETRELAGSPDIPSDPKKDLKIVAEVQQYFEGPLPPPDFAERYEHLLPGSLDRILGLAERQQQARLQMEDRQLAHRVTQETRRHEDAVAFQKQILQSYSRREYTGMLLGFVLALCVLGIATLVIVSGRSLEAGVALVIADAAVVAGVFLVARRRDDEELPAR